MTSRGDATNRRTAMEEPACRWVFSNATSGLVDDGHEVFIDVPSRDKKRPPTRALDLKAGPLIHADCTLVRGMDRELDTRKADLPRPSQHFMKQGTCDAFTPMGAKYPERKRCGVAQPIGLATHGVEETNKLLRTSGDEAKRVRPAIQAHDALSFILHSIAELARLPEHELGLLEERAAKSKQTRCVDFLRGANDHETRT